MNNKDFKVPEDKRMHFQTFPEMGNFYDELYEKGLGFDKEKNLERKSSGKYLILNSATIKRVGEKYEGKQKNSQSK